MMQICSITLVGTSPEMVNRVNDFRVAHLSEREAAGSHLRGSAPLIPAST